MKELREYLQSQSQPKILIVQPSRIGDVLFTMPALASIRKRFPNAWIGWFVDERCAPIIRGCPDLDEVIVFDRDRLTSLPYVLELRRYLHGKKIDLSIDFHGLFKSAFMVTLAGAKYRIASSSTNGMRELSWLFSIEIKPRNKNLHCVMRHLAVAKYLGGDVSKIEYHVAVEPEAKQRVDNLLTEKGVVPGKPLVAVHPGGGWISRRWFPERFADLINRLQDELGAQVVLVGGKEGGAGEKGLNEEILAGLKRPAFDLTGAMTLKELAALLQRCSLFVANEAGPMHLATALSVPSIALLGPTNPDRTGPYGGKTKVVRHLIDCQPCRERSCPRRECMKLITVDEVFTLARQILSEGKTDGR